MQSANVTLSIARLLGLLVGLAVVGFSGTADAVPPPPPPPPKSKAVGTPPPPPPGAPTSAGTPPPPPPVAPTSAGAPPPPPPPNATPPATTEPSALQPAPLAPPPPPPAPQQAVPAQEQPRRRNGPWENGSVPMTWGGTDPAYGAMWPARIDYEEGDVIPPGYEVKTRPERGLLMGGVVSLVVPYTISFLVGGFAMVDGNDRIQREYGPLLLPVFGPFVSLGLWEETSEQGAFLMLANGFAQTAGAAMIASSILMPAKTIERMAKLPGKPEVFVGPGQATLRMRF